MALPTRLSLFQVVIPGEQHHQTRDNRLRIDYMSRMIHLTASFWYFYYDSSLAAGGLRSI
ncbi:hypothetical protein [Mesorhizobium sp. WSM4906]|uniref:hypothetical protein n=1 Tax=Mesorhizobium sp. WSM4906 TaxID=3038546 RepID=UPI0024175365|nr:hypothetical protein [Mesorhizobium sp. WSM4906]WFP76761.1 hypothetical protein QAZ22_02595 [Mesorhizobium sp. WSM4906]